MKFPGIERAALEIGYDNGMINRECSQEQFLHNVYMVISAMYTLCCGEEQDGKEIENKSPQGTGFLLNEIFNTV